MLRKVTRLLGWGFGGLLLGFLVRSGQLAVSQGTAITLAMTASAFSVGIFYPPGSVDKRGLQD
jgi:hypothetical protein